MIHSTVDTPTLALSSLAEKKQWKQLAPGANSSKAYIQQTTAAGLLSQAGSKSSALACGEYRKEEIQAYDAAWFADVLLRWPWRTWRKEGTRTPPSAFAPTSYFPGKATEPTGCVWDITGPYLFKLTMEAFCPALLKTSFHSSSSPRITYL